VRTLEGEFHDDDIADAEKRYSSRCMSGNAPHRPRPSSKRWAVGPTVRDADRRVGKRPSEVKASTQPLTSTFSARSMLCEYLFVVHRKALFLLGLSKLRQVTCRVCIRVATRRPRFLKLWLPWFRPDKRWRSNVFLLIRHPFRDRGASIVCSECHQLAKYRTVERRLALASSAYLEIRLPCKEAIQRVRQARLKHRSFMLRIERSGNSEWCSLSVAGCKRGYRAVPTTAHRRGPRAVRDVRFARCDARESGRRNILAHCEADGITLERCPLHVRN